MVTAGTDKERAQLLVKKQILMVLSSFHLGLKTGSSSSLCRFNNPGVDVKKCEEQPVEVCLARRISS